MSQCTCAEMGVANEPRDVIDLKTPLYQACGGRLYRLHILTDASAVSMGDGMDMETRINTIERLLQANTTTYFADTIPQRDQIGGLTAGDRCYVFDATGDKTVPYGSAMYIWLPSRKWRKLYMGESPVDCLNLITPNGGLAVDANGKIYVDFSKAPASAITQITNYIYKTGGGLAVGSDGKLYVDAGTLINTGSGLQVVNNKLSVKPADFIRANGGLVVGTDGKVYVDFSTLPASSLTAITNYIYKTGGGLAMGSDGKLSVKPADFIKANGGLAVGADGKVYVDFSKMPDSEMRNVVLSMVQTGGGIGVDSTGKLYVDFGSMPTDKFDAMLKTLRLPIWLTANKNFYVNPVTGSDTLDDKRGESESKPFKTIQACVNYVADNFNVSRYTAFIVIADGTYEETVTLPEFSRNTGSIQLKSQSGDRSKVVIVGRQLNMNTINVTGGVYALVDLTIDFRPNLAQMADAKANGYSSVLDATDAQVFVYGCLFRFAPVGTEVPKFKYVNYGLAANSNATISLQPWTKANRFETGFDISVTGLENYIFSATNGGQILARGSNTESYTAVFELNALYDACAMAASQGLQRWTFASQEEASVTNEARPSGKCYRCYSGGSIDVGGKGEDFFPGANPGTADAATFSWYK